MVTFGSTEDNELPYVNALAESYVRANPDGEHFNDGVLSYGDWAGRQADNYLRVKGVLSDAVYPASPDGGASPPDGASGGGPAGAPPAKSALPEKFQWVNDPEKLSGFLADFNRRYPLNPSNAPQPVKDVYGNMKAPETNYGPPTGVNADTAKYWANYFGYPDQYANNKVSVESKGKADAWVAGSQAAGLNQVRPIAAEDVGFKFGDRKNGKLGPEDAEDFRNAMKDPNFNSMVSTMYSRKVFNIEKGDPFKAEAGYNKGPYGFSPGEPWKNEAQEYVRNMFPGQWDGSMK
ncbi:hypothetical protein [Fundidesulfovibrio terrae]|uniref:hypothetical protein n=1 Tax=Fundidesulfovibrio terrae TaxID=2922866 RepID=UPI001FAFDA27|nr:hypothetical protein [Fundidesulfovibrio terrae]